MIAKDIMMLVAGNLVEIVNLRAFEHKYLRSTSGAGIGALVVSHFNQSINQPTNQNTFI